MMRRLHVFKTSWRVSAINFSSSRSPVFTALNLSMFELAQDYCASGMTAYASLQNREFELEATRGYRAVKHQTFVGTGYFDQIAQTNASATNSTTALAGSTEEEQFIINEESWHTTYMPA